MKQFGIKPAWLLAAGAIFALSVTILNSCSSDEDYDMYMGDELRTHAAATRSAAPEPGGGTNNRDDPAGYANDVDNCGGVVLSQLHCESKTDQCDTYTMAYYHVKQLAGGSCSNMTPEKIIEVAGKLSGVSLSAYYTIGENSDTAAFYLKKFDSLSKKIIIYRMANSTSEHTGLHAAIGRELNDSKADKSKWSVDVYGNKDGVTISTVLIGKIAYIIY